MYEFAEDWLDEITEISTLPEFQNATVTLIDPDLVVETEDLETGEYTLIFSGEVWSGQTRLIAMRTGVNRLNEDSLNADTQTPILVQFPTNQNFVPDEEWVDNGDGTWTVTSEWMTNNPDGTWTYYGPLIDNGDGTWTWTPWSNYRVRRGMILRVDECERNHSLESMLFIARSDFQGSNAAARSVQFILSSDMRPPSG